MNPTLLLADIHRMRDTSNLLLVQSQMRAAAADVRRAKTLLAKAQRKLNWARSYKPSTN